MHFKRIIPVLLLRGSGFVKTVRFKDPVYLGDSFNTVRLFNEKETDELIILDIDATIQGRGPRFDFLRDLASECFMPVSYGGGVRTVEDMRRLFEAGFEKVSINSAAIKNPQLISQAAREFGSQSVVVSLDVRRRMFGRHEVFVENGKKATGMSPIEAAQRAVDLGAGEILLNSIDLDGTMTGYDLELIENIARSVSVPLIACGGAGNLNHMVEVIDEAGASAAAAGSVFVFTGRHRAVLITYPTQAELNRG